jgi:hypothetical protein
MKNAIKAFMRHRQWEARHTNSRNTETSDNEEEAKQEFDGAAPPIHEIRGGLALSRISR